MSIEFIVYKLRLQRTKGFCRSDCVTDRSLEHSSYELIYRIQSSGPRPKAIFWCPNHCWERVGANGAHTSVVSPLTHSSLMLTHKQFFGELPTGVRTRLRFRSEDSVEAYHWSVGIVDATHRTPRWSSQSQAKIDKSPNVNYDKLERWPFPPSLS